MTGPIVFGISLTLAIILIVFVFAIGSVGLWLASTYLNLKNQDFFTAFGVSMLSLLVTSFIVFVNDLFQVDFLIFGGLFLGVFVSLFIIKKVYDLSWGMAIITWFIALILQITTYVIILVFAVILGAAVLG